MKYLVVIAVMFVMFAYGCKNEKSNEDYYLLKTEYDVVNTDSTHADIYLKHKLNLRRLDSIADSCFKQGVKNNSREYRVSFSYWNDGKFRQVVAEKIWLHDLKQHIFKVGSIRKIERHNDLP